VSKLKYVFAWQSNEAWNCKTADDGASYHAGDTLALQLGETERWFRLYERVRVGNVVALHLYAVADQFAERTVSMTNAVAEFLLHLEGVKNDA